jgi:2-succinyl-5-enolpyruvyl-6-hydroxy-3-cyclohexene-1-carboxylate synthase
MKDQGRINLDWCLALLDGLVSAGVSDIVVSPGSRSTPLTLSAVLHPQLNYHVVVDERGAGFFALGLARKSNRAVALVCTSGTAVANWMPAVVEANHQQTPLLLLSADRPWELQQCAANQTIDQVKFFGDQVRGFHQLPVAEMAAHALSRVQRLGRQAVRQATALNAGPVHINIPLREPLAPDELPRTHQEVTVDIVKDDGIRLNDDLVQGIVARLSGKPGVIVCGAGADSVAIAELGEALTCPVLADPLSGLRFSPAVTALAHYDLFLHATASHDLKADWVLYFGATPVSKSLQNYLEHQTKATHWRVDQSGREMGRGSIVAEILSASDQQFCKQLLGRGLSGTSPAWKSQWLSLEQQVEHELQQRRLPPEGQVIRQALRQLPAHSSLFAGNSLSVRFMDAYSGSLDKGFDVYGNRGASGIDGNLATMSGIASASEKKLLGIVGDLTFFHDLNSLALARSQDMIVLLLNNQGGGIFDFLPRLSLPDYETCWRTPVPIDHEHIAGAFGISYARVEEIDEFEDVFWSAMEGSGMQLIEVMTDSVQSRLLHRNIIDIRKAQ